MINETWMLVKQCFSIRQGRWRTFLRVVLFLLAYSFPIFSTMPPHGQTVFYFFALFTLAADACCVKSRHSLSQEGNRSTSIPFADVGRAWLSLLMLRVAEGPRWKAHTRSSVGAWPSAEGRRRAGGDLRHVFHLHNISAPSPALAPFAGRWVQPLVCHLNHLLSDLQASFSAFFF